MEATRLNIWPLISNFDHQILFVIFFNVVFSADLMYSIKNIFFERFNVFLRHVPIKKVEKVFQNRPRRER